MIHDRAAGLFLAVTLAGCGGTDEVNISEVDSRGFVSIRADVWVDNWFALYLEDRLLIEDSVPMAVERSFNAETFTFRADLPMQLNFVLRDFRENDTGLEYIGGPTSRLVMGVSSPSLSTPPVMPFSPPPIPDGVAWCSTKPPQTHPAPRRAIRPLA